MTDRPIIFSAPMVRALLDGRKTQTRLIRDGVPSAPAFDDIVHEPRHAAPYLDAYCSERRSPVNPRGMGPWWYWWTRDNRCGSQFRVGHVPGDRLWVRERIAFRNDGGIEWATYAADDAWVKNGIVRVDPARLGDRPRASIHMPRWASRLTLTVANVRVQRLQEISEVDAIAEGALTVPLAAHGAPEANGRPPLGPSPRQRYEALWNTLHGPDAWSANPWVVALTFAVEPANIDALREAA